MLKVGWRSPSAERLQSSKSMHEVHRTRIKCECQQGLAKRSQGVRSHNIGDTVSILRVTMIK
jgi:hypothetical protein